MNIRWPLPEIELFLRWGSLFILSMAIGYTIDVYNGLLRKSILESSHCLYPSPTHTFRANRRGQEYASAIQTKPDPDYGMIVSGLKLMLWVYFMKLVVADRLAFTVDAVYQTLANTTVLLYCSRFFYTHSRYMPTWEVIHLLRSVLRGSWVPGNGYFRRPFFCNFDGRFLAPLHNH